jgi:hypothetical protein
MSGKRQTCRISQRRPWFTRLQEGWAVVPIRGFLAGRTFDTQVINAMSLAFDSTCDHLGLVKTTEDPATSLVAEKIIDIAQRGILDADLLHAMALNELGRD